MTDTPFLQPAPLSDLLTRWQHDLHTLQRCAPTSDTCAVLTRLTRELQQSLAAAAAPAPLYVSADEAASRLGLQADAVRNLCRTGRVPGARKCGSAWRIPTSYLQSHGSAPQGGA